MFSDNMRKKDEKKKTSQIVQIHFSHVQVYWFLVSYPFNICWAS